MIDDGSEGLDDLLGVGLRPPPAIALLSFIEKLEGILVRKRSVRTARERYKFLLVVTGDLMSDLDAPDCVVDEYYKLACILDDLDRGKVHSILVKTDAAGVPDTTLDWLARAEICLAMAAVMECGKSQKEASEFLVNMKEFRNAAETVRKSNRGDLARNIRGWYELFSTNARRDDIGQVRFNHRINVVKAAVLSNSEEERLKEAKHIAQQAARRVRRLTD